MGENPVNANLSQNELKPLEKDSSNIFDQNKSFIKVNCIKLLFLNSLLQKKLVDNQNI